ncbi:MAG: co-chaperone GroES [Actinobacteria bacterium]|nr:co-chaperone GroES [Actinomycetota bacterium]
MGLKPLGDRVLVRVEEAEEALPSGLVIPDTAKEKPQEGSVLAVGPGAISDGKRVPLDVKKGDRIIFSKFGGTEVKVEGEDLMILNERDILAVVEK